MKTVLLVLIISLTGCAGGGESPSAPSPDCDRATSPQDVSWPDNQIRKSVVTSCTFQNGVTCDLIAWVNDETVNFTTCPNGYL